MVVIMMIGFAPTPNAFTATPTTDSNSGATYFTEYSRNKSRGTKIKSYLPSRSQRNLRSRYFTDYSRRKNRGGGRTRSYRHWLDEEEMGL